MLSGPLLLKADVLDSGRRGYHHGRLKEALLEAARCLVVERGINGFSLGDAAKLVGVTAAAPYRHYPDTNALVAELGQRGFEKFSDCLETAWNDGQPDPYTAFMHTGPAYLAFVREEPGMYAAMFGNFSIVAVAGPCAAAQRALEILFRTTGGALKYLGGPENRIHQLAMQVWSLSHGVATLAMSGYLDDPEPLLSAGMAQLIQGVCGTIRTGA